MATMMNTSIVSAQKPDVRSLSTHVQTEFVSSRNAATEYLKTLGTEVSRKAVRARLNRIARWFHYDDAEHCDWQLMRYEHIADFVEYLKTYDGAPATHQKKEKGLTSSAINTYIYAIKAVFKKAWELGQVSDHELMRIRSFKVIRNYEIPTGRAMNRSETRALLDSCDDDAPQDIRDRAILMLMIGNGIRRAEVTAILMKNINIEAGEIKLIGKGRKERMVFMTPRVLAAVKNWLNTRQSLPVKERSDDTEDANYLFCRFTRHHKSIVTSKPLDPTSVWRILNDHKDEVKDELPSITDLSCHDCRRTFATGLFDNGVDISVIRNLMGHSNIATTAKYDKRGTNAMRRAMGTVEI